MRKTIRKTQDEKREAALADIREKVDSGSLVIRRMTEEERARYGPVTSQGSRRRA